MASSLDLTVNLLDCVGAGAEEGGCETPRGGSYLGTELTKQHGVSPMKQPVSPFGCSSVSGGGALHPQSVRSGLWL